MTQHTRGHGLSDVTFDISRDGTLVVFSGEGRGGRDLYTYDLQSGSVTRLTNSVQYEVAPSFSSDGRRVVYAAGTQGDRADHLYMIDLGTSKVTQLTEGESNDTSPRFSPDGRHVVFTREFEYRWGGLASSWNEAGQIWMIDVESRAAYNDRPSVDMAISPRYSPTGQEIAWHSPDGVYLAGINGRTLRIADDGQDVSFSRDGQSLLFSQGTYSPDHKIYRMSLTGYKKELVAKTKGGCFWPVEGADSWVYYLVEKWPDGPTGTVEFSLWRARDGKDELVADRALFKGLIGSQ